MRLPHIVSSEQFTDTTLLESLFKVAREMEELDHKGPLPQLLSGKILASLFYEPSTRTRFSFESACLKLGGRVISTENAREFSSVSKGETLEDTIRVIGGYADVIVMRHFEQGAAARAAQVSPVPIINAGDGVGDHPTQGLLDLYTIQKNLGRVSGIRVTVAGDLLNGRTVHSLLKFTALYEGVSFDLVSPPELSLPSGYLDFFRTRNISFRVFEELAPVLPEADVVYMTRVQKERFASVAQYDELKNAFVLTPALVTTMKPNSLIMHPLPRNAEIAPEVDTDSRARYFEQARNGLYVRMALLDQIFNGIN